MQSRGCTLRAFLCECFVCINIIVLKCLYMYFTVVGDSFAPRLRGRGRMARFTLFLIILIIHAVVVAVRRAEPEFKALRGDRHVALLQALFLDLRPLYEAAGPLSGEPLLQVCAGHLLPGV